MSEHTEIAGRLAAVEARVAAACAAAGRERSEVRLLAVSKTKPAALIRAALDAGQRDFGENYAQELRDKARAFEGAAPAPRWHFIGHLQRNKVKYVVGRAALLHAVHSLRLGEAIGRRAGGHPQAVLVEVNVGGEASKSGVRPAEALGLCEALAAVEGVSVRGLMAIPPRREDPADAAPFFRELAALAAEGRRRGLALTELSMGMSHDFEVAIACGATIVRVGTAIFGARDRAQPAASSPR